MNWCKQACGQRQGSCSSRGRRDAMGSSRTMPDLMLLVTMLRSSKALAATSRTARQSSCCVAVCIRQPPCQHGLQHHVTW